MQPIVHLAVGYLCYSGYTRFTRHKPPEAMPLLAALFGALLPDLLDKPLELLGVAPVGRTIGHSLLFAIPLVASVWLLLRRRSHERIAVAFAIGYGSHLASDVPWHLLSGDYDELGFLLWPITPMPEYTGTKSLGAVFGVEITTLWVEVVILFAGIALWWHDGRPGLESVRR